MNKESPSNSLPQWFSSGNKNGLLLGCLILFYLISGISYLRTQSVTADENSFYLYAKRWARGNPERIDPATDDSKTPVVVLNLLPRAVEQVFHPGLHKADDGAEDIIRARYMTLFFSVFTLLLVYRWSKECFGKTAALFAVFLLVLEPSFLANAALVTTDSYSAFFLLAVCYSLWKCLKVRSWRWIVILSVAVAGAQLVKQSLLHLYLLLPLILAAQFFLTNRRPALSKLLKPALVFVFIQFLLINAGYYFSGFGTRLGDYPFFSETFRQIRQSLPAGLRLPFPRPFVQAFDMTRYYDEIGGGILGKSGFGNVTLLGQSFRGHGVWYYYFVSLFFKAPVTFIILLVWALVLAASRKFSERKTLICLLVPPGYFLVYFSFFYQVQIGVRHIVFLVPLICVFLSGMLTAVRSAWASRLLAVLSLYLICSNLYYWQHQYSYTNEFITDETFAYRLVGSSNLDYGQGRYWGNRYLQTHPDVQWASGTRRAGKFLIPVQQYMDVYNEHKMDWLTSHLPFGQVAFSQLLVEIKAEDLDPR